MVVWSMAINQVTFDFISFCAEPHPGKIEISAAIDKYKTSKELNFFEFVKFFLDVRI